MKVFVFLISAPFILIGFLYFFVAQALYDGIEFGKYTQDILFSPDEASMGEK